MKNIILLCALVSAAIFPGCAHTTTEEEQKVTQLVERQKVEDVVNKLFIETDQRHWREVAKLFSDQVNLDMSSLSRQPASVETPKQIINGWEKGLSPVQAIQHQTSNFLTEISGTNAKVFCYGTATHYKNPAFRENVASIVGSYDVHLVKVGDTWKIDSMKFNKKYVE